MSEQAGVGSEDETHASEGWLAYTFAKVSHTVKETCHWSCRKIREAPVLVNTIVLSLRTCRMQLSPNLGCRSQSIPTNHYVHGRQTT